MIWILMGILVLAGLLYVTLPLYAQNINAVSNESERTDYAQEISKIDAQLAAGEGDKSALEQAKTELARQLLASDTASDSKVSAPQTLTLMIIFAVFCFGTLGIYSQIGAPELAAFKDDKPTQMPQSSASGAMGEKSMEELIVQLEQRLQADPNNAEGWMLYANSLMHVQRYDEALAAFEKVLVLTDNDPNVALQLSQAKRFIAQKRGQAPQISPSPNAPGPSAADIDAAGQMSPQERMAMIEGMVEGLSAKLEDNPRDVGGWVRLLNARRVLGQTETANTEIARMKSVFKDSQATIDQILSESGWAQK